MSRLFVESADSSQPLADWWDLVEVQTGEYFDANDAGKYKWKLRNNGSEFEYFRLNNALLEREPFYFEQRSIWGAKSAFRKCPTHKIQKCVSLVRENHRNPF